MCLDNGLLNTESVSPASFESSAFIVVGASGSGKSTLLQKMAASDKSIISLRNFTTRQTRSSDCSTQIEFTTQEVFFNALKRRELFYARRKHCPDGREYFVGYRKSEIHDAFNKSLVLGMTSHFCFAVLVVKVMRRVPIILLTTSPDVALKRINEREEDILPSGYGLKQEAINKTSKKTIQELEQLAEAVDGALLKLDTAQMTPDECSAGAHAFVRAKLLQNQQQR